ncbi:MAG: Rab family GTPase [Pyrobaculum sp.]
MRRRVVLLGVGGVGKTTLVYRLIGFSAVPYVTLKPGLYRLYFVSGSVELLDVPGQHAVEVAQRAARQMRRFFDRAVLMYDLTRPETLYALGEILESICMFKTCLLAREVVVAGNKRDLAEEYGYMVENTLLPYDTYYISAANDPPEELAKIVA